MDDLQKNDVGQKKPDKKSDIYLFTRPPPKRIFIYSYKVQQLAKLIYGDKCKNSSYFWE